MFFEYDELVCFRLPPLSAKEGMSAKPMLTSLWVKHEFFQTPNYIHFWGSVNCGMVAYLQVLMPEKPAI
jgi:hypothetical protein